MILIIDNYDSFTYNLYQVIAAMEKDVRVIRNDQITVEEVQRLNPKAIFLSPGPGRPEDAGICMELIKACAPQIPIFGVCLGHQAIAAAFGGNVISAGDIVHGKPAVIFHHRAGLFKGMPLPFEAGRYHSLMVEKSSLPTDLVVEAETSDGLIMAIRHTRYACYGVQFHPESILTPQGHTLIRNFLCLH
jgi:anthranilate synthase component 2